MMAPLLLANSEVTQKIGIQGDVSDRAPAQIASAEDEKKRWTTTRKDRGEVALPSNLEKEESAETRETSEQDQGECRDRESLPENTKQAFQLEFDCKTRESQKPFSQDFFQDLNAILADQVDNVTQVRETPMGRTLEKPENVLRGWNMLAPPKKLEKALNKLKNKKGSPDQITTDVLKALLPGLSGKTVKIGVTDVLGNVNFLEDWLCSLTVMAPKVEGATSLAKVQANRWFVCDAKNSWPSFGSTVTPSSEIRECADGVCAEDTCRCWPVPVVTSCRIVEGMAESSCGGTIGREEGVRSRGSSSGLQGNETTRCEPVFDGTDWNGSCIKARLGTVSSNKARMSRGLPQGSPMVMELLLRDLIKKLDNPETGVETGRLCADCDLQLGRCGVGCCVGGCCGSDGGRGHRKVEKCRSECWCTENTLDESKASWWTDWLCCGRKSWSLWDRRCVWTGMQDIRSRTEQLKPTNVWRKGDLF